MNKYKYLKKYILSEAPTPRNWFNPINIEEIINAEKRLGFSLPEHLKEFWLEIGEGTLCISIDGHHAAGFNNIVLSPTEVANILLLKEESNLIMPHIVEYMTEGDIPFFDLGSSSFFVMKPNSAKPKAVYDFWGGDIVEESFEKFIWRLYHESPTFYLDNIEIEKKPTMEERLVGTPPRGWLWQYLKKNYTNLIWDEGIEEEFLLGGEPAAQQIREKYKDEIKFNRCSKCGNLKLTPRARQCLNCGTFSDPILE